LKIFLDIGFDVYTSLLAKLDLSNAEHKRLKSALVIAGGEQTNGGLVVAILCELEKANALLEFAKKNCPEAVLDIATSINFYSGQLLDREH
jgi:hypothetical protein